MRVQNERLVCDFSSLTGATLVKEIAEEKSTKQRAPGHTGKGSPNQLTRVDHEEMRNNIESVSAGLDIMLAAFKKN